MLCSTVQHFDACVANVKSCFMQNGYPEHLMPNTPIFSEEKRARLIGYSRSGLASSSGLPPQVPAPTKVLA